MSAHSDREVQCARRRYASGDIAFDRRADALALRNKLRREYERRSSEQDPMACGRCGKELVRCLAKQDVTDCCYHRGELCTTRKSRGMGVPRWSCCQLTGEGATGCQRGGRHTYEAIHPTFEDWFEHWATVTGQGSTHMCMPLCTRDTQQMLSSPSPSSVLLVSDRWDTCTCCSDSAGPSSTCCGAESTDEDGCLCNRCGRGCGSAPAASASRPMGVDLSTCRLGLLPAPPTWSG